MNLTTDNKCLVKGCANHQSQGMFVGELCKPCHSMITTGHIGCGKTFIHQLAGSYRQLLEGDSRGNDAIDVTPEIIAPKLLN